MMTNTLRTISLLGALSLAISMANSQPATPAQRAGVAPQPGFATMHLETLVGSCKFIDGQGRIEMTFSGSIMIHRLKGTRVVSAGLTRQYVDEKREREVWYGRGRIVITGEWRGIQWFGKDMKAVWYGRGTVRLAGEYYQSPTRPGEFESGWMWYDNPAERREWPNTGSFEHRLPAPQMPAPVVPRRRTS